MAFGNVVLKKVLVLECQFLEFIWTKQYSYSYWTRKFSKTRI